MARINERGIQRRAVIESRQSAPEQYRVQVSGAAAQSYSAVSNVTAGVLGRLSAAANGLQQDRQVRQNREDALKGEQQRTQESVEGEAPQPQDALASFTPAFRRGYYVTEASNKLNEAKRGLIARVAALDVGEDPQAAIQETLSGLMQQKEFQDPQVMAQLQPAVAQLRQQALDVHSKTETAELLERQTENVGAMLRTAALDGSLLKPGAIENFAKALDTEEFAFVSRNEFYDQAAGQIVDAMATGEGNIQALSEFAKKATDEHGTSLWDRKHGEGTWSDAFTQAARAGVAVQQRMIEERQASVQAEKEVEWQDQAYVGRMTEGSINANADALGLSGKDRHTFVRHWYDQNQAGIRRMEQEAKEAARHKETIQVLTAGQGLTLETHQLQKAFSKEWTDAVKAGNKQAMGTALARATRAGVVIPAVQDLIGRTTSTNLTQNYATYKAIADIDPITAMRYVSEDNAILMNEYHENRTAFGMSEQEALQQITRPEQKAVRAEVSQRIGRAATAYFKKVDEMPDGTPMPPWMQDRVQREATRLAMRNPMAPPDAAVATAFKRVQGDLANVNGRWVQRGGMRTGAESGVTEFVRRAAVDAEKSGAIPKGTASGVFAAPTEDDPNVFILHNRDGFPIYGKASDGTQRPVIFDPNKTAAGVNQWKRDEAEKQARFDAQNKPKMTVMGIDPVQAAAMRTAKGDPSLKPTVLKLGDKPTPVGPKRPDATDMIDYLSTFKN
ncbi:hypothetical protein ACDH70_06875 [Xanthomonas axonopodis pv. poinsettiicola]|uniref:hypothetical protein n=1 Tax=Xanthomonas TaxID=338 RepID=UPI001E2EAE28|nr:hypothetical protein [Xanthomonas codiaei]MCC8537491.1 hypothetical protein [Xanthomonas codiaei]